MFTLLTGKCFNLLYAQYRRLRSSKLFLPAASDLKWWATRFTAFIVTLIYADCYWFLFFSSSNAFSTLLQCFNQIYRWIFINRYAKADEKNRTLFFSIYNNWFHIYHHYQINLYKLEHNEADHTAEKRRPKGNLKLIDKLFISDKR